jgi:hypothetical protein
MMATSRWDGPVHYYDYDEATVTRRPGRDAYTVAEAFIYNADETASLALVFLVSGQDLRARRVTMARAIAEARGHLERLTRPGGIRFEEAKTLTQDKTLTFSWDGRMLA